MSQRLFITGATGFIGSHLLHSLSHYPLSFFGKESNIRDVRLRQVQDIFCQSDWEKALKGHEVIIHLMGKAHILNGENEDYHSINTRATEIMTKAALAVGVRKIIFLSTIGVYGSKKSQPQLITENTPLNPDTPYAKSKLEAEEILLNMTQMKDLQVIILRPPLVYGLGAPGNFAQLLKLSKLGLLLPLGGIKNQRSFIYVKNLCHLIEASLKKEKFCGVYNVADQEIISTSYLISLLCHYNKSFNFYFPKTLLRILAKTVGRGQMLEKLTNNLAIDVTKIQRKLNWTPPYTITQAIEEMHQIKKEPISTTIKSSPS